MVVGGPSFPDSRGLCSSSFSEVMVLEFVSQDLMKVDVEKSVDDLVKVLEDHGNNAISAR